MVIGSPQSWTEILKEAADNPIMMGDMIIVNSKSEKYLGDQIHEDGCAASITATLDGRIPIAIERGETIIDTCNHPALLGQTIAFAPVEQFESKVLSKILSNSNSWIGLTKQHIKRAR